MPARGRGRAALRHHPASALQRGHGGDPPARGGREDGLPARSASKSRSSTTRPTRRRRSFARTSNDWPARASTSSTCTAPIASATRRARSRPGLPRRAASSSPSSTPISCLSPDFVRACEPHFRDPRVGMVQTRWGHMNRDHSLLTKVQALMLDGHHMVENRARFASGSLFNFSGTGGMWRREAIDERGRLAARHPHRGPRPLLPRAARRLEVRLPRGRRLPRRATRRGVGLPRAAVSLGQGDGADVAQAAQTRVVGPRAEPRAARRGVLPPDAAFRLSAHGALVGAAFAGPHPHAGHRHPHDAAARSPALHRHHRLARRVLHARRGCPGSAADGRDRASAGAHCARRRARAASHPGGDGRARLHGWRVRPHAEEGAARGALPRAHVAGQRSKSGWRCSRSPASRHQSKRSTGSRRPSRCSSPSATATSRSLSGQSRRSVAARRASSKRPASPIRLGSSPAKGTPASWRRNELVASPELVASQAIHPRSETRSPGRITAGVSVRHCSHRLQRRPPKAADRA